MTFWYPITLKPEVFGKCFKFKFDCHQQKTAKIPTKKYMKKCNKSNRKKLLSV